MNSTFGDQNRLQTGPGKQRKKVPKLILNSYEEGLFEELRQLRLRIARDDGVPAYIVFHNSTLQLMASYIPLSHASLSRIPGVGPVKLEKWGDEFLAVIWNYALLHGLGERPIPDRKSDIPRATDNDRHTHFKRKIPWHRSSSTQDLNILLSKYFGHDEFWRPQKEIILSLLKGQDALVVMSTGGGKSLCYQLPALMFDGLTLVILASDCADERPGRRFAVQRYCRSVPQ